MVQLEKMQTAQTNRDLITREASIFLSKLHHRFEKRRRTLLEERQIRQKEFDRGGWPDFLEETKSIRESDWTIAPIPPDLMDRRVEITGPASDPKMVINAFNSGAKVFMADFEDALAPTFENVMQGQKNLYEAIRGTLTFVADGGKRYQLNDQIATLVVRPRGWHLIEKHFLVEDEPISASLFDFGLFMFHNAKALIEKGSGPYFYLPKLENHQEARLWNDVFVFALGELGIPKGTIKATVLIETILAAFEADEILYELKDHSAGLNCGRWDYIFSVIKKFRNNDRSLLPDRSQVTMTVPFMRAYTLYVVKTCHKRNAHAIGGMAAQIPIKNDPSANSLALQKVYKDKEREVQDGFDGSWVAHPGLVATVMNVFNEHMPQANQINRQRDDIQISAEALLAVTKGKITEAGLRLNISVGIQYIEAWLLGRGAVPLYHLMEDAATAEISRAQVWQWIRHPDGILDDGKKVTIELVKHLIDEEVQKMKVILGNERFENGRFKDAVELFNELVEKEDFIEFLTVPGYDYLP
ncbi:MAG: malate synthase A [Tuberibacillus sp.]